ncbi:MAG: tRNA (N6-threonylcarbamoyladenosine(37)-N6)-methyltransferase TrmO [Bryobacterales bacterium]|nr:tRNA (N6-threonylcarbamoyladenosine(37)-N6)-methyltransferase TrmO [Bryobacteraceae bacterium]MDW8131334.1 tRNA (N6-threonylcarbamoyladenosine(37)-N6)-methyltransferase TrmO [Bryobacterales bacterium]
MTEERAWHLQAIGVVRSEIKERKQMPPLGAPAAIEIFPEFVPGLWRLDKHTHIWVLAWLHGAGRDLLQVVPRGVRAEEPDALHGVFAVRSPVRPNPIGLTATRIVRIEGARIEVARLDFIDGTPVVDLKPYFVSRDLIFSAANVQIGRPASRESLREALLEQALNFHGEHCPELALGVRLLEHFRWEVLAGADPDGLRVAAPWERGCLLDALMGMTRASPGRGTLSLAVGHRVRFEFKGAAYEYRLREREEHGAAAVFAAPDEALFELAISATQ